jgi:intraflagellar transport protein 46
MPKPDGVKEDFGITVLDETVNNMDPSVLEMKYIQTKKTIKKVEMTVRSIENAEKNTRDIDNWIKNIPKNKLPSTIQYSKMMPDFDKLMEEWPPSIESMLKEVDFPGPEIELPCEDYAKIMSTMLDIPIHKGASNKGVIEALHVMFTLYSDFKENQHFQKQQQQEVVNERDDDKDFMAINH